MKKNKKSGFIIVLVMFIITILLLLALYYLNFIITDLKIATSHKLASQTYYLAEAGINEAIWKLINDQDWYNNFISNPTWQATINRTNVFAINDGYQVIVQNLEIAKAEITSTAFNNTSNQSSQRVIKIKVYKSLNPYLSEIISVYTNDNFKLWGVNIDINNSNIYSSNDIKLNFFSTLNVDGDVSALGNIVKSWTSNISALSLHSINYPPPPSSLEMPQIDFDSDSPGSYFNRADQIFSQQEFQTYLNNNPNGTLNGITYVQGNINIHNGINLTINGLLVIDGNFKIGVSGGQFWEPNPSLIINKTTGQPAGLLSKKSITFGSLVNNIEIDGLVYAANTFSVKNLIFPITINGGVITYQFDINSLWQSITINFDQDVIASTLSDTEISPVINIEHWEEEY